MSEKIHIDIDKAIEIAEWYNGKRTVLSEITPEDADENYIKQAMKLAKKKKKYNAEKELYKKEFKQNRNIVLIIDNYKCRECGSTDDLNVHHIKKRSKGGTNDINNLITLCAKCHAEKHKKDNVYHLMRKRLA